MNKEEISKFVKDSYKEVFGENYDEAKAEESLKKIFEAAGDDMTKAEASANAIVGKLKAKNEAIQKKQEQFDNLKAIQEELFDAPDEVKANFNKVVQYFAAECHEEKSFGKGDDFGKVGKGFYGAKVPSPDMLKAGIHVLTEYEKNRTQYDPIKVLQKELGCNEDQAKYIAMSF